jgi:hypothetical protein
MSADQGYHGRHRHGDDRSPCFPGQPGGPHDDPQVDTSLVAVQDFGDCLALAALMAGNAGREPQATEALLQASLAEAEFGIGSDVAEAMGVLLSFVRERVTT